MGYNHRTTHHAHCFKAEPLGDHGFGLLRALLGVHQKAAVLGPPILWKKVEEPMVHGESMENLWKSRFNGKSMEIYG